MYSGEYTPPTLTVDAVVFQLIDGRLHVLLIKRSQDPFKNCWALPGGYNAAGETTQEAFARILQLKAGVNSAALDLVEQLYTFDTVARDPRGHAVSVTYLGLGRRIDIGTSSTTQTPQFFPVDQLPELAYDHANIIRYAVERLQSKLSYTNIVYSVLPEKFTLSQLQSAYESILGQALDKRNFRKKFLSLDAIEETNDVLKEGAHRPARLYSFRDQQLQPLERSFA